ncbi:uncharacterized protein LOC133819374 [Humulus lupulus]|uniref:uncharacterized protein LOC133819374 n=1 Tax=Humulus lupulus TaxID=3486 RepID=UPI002B409D73|nr:uncharacterized protein LOC133819374 [Humulus lupulus]
MAMEPNVNNFVLESQLIMCNNSQRGRFDFEDQKGGCSYISLILIACKFGWKAEGYWWKGDLSCCGGHLIIHKRPISEKPFHEEIKSVMQENEHGKDSWYLGLCVKDEWTACRSRKTFI